MNDAIKRWIFVRDGKNLTIIGQVCNVVGQTQNIFSKEWEWEIIA